MKFADKKYSRPFSKFIDTNRISRYGFIPDYEITFGEMLDYIKGDKLSTWDIASYLGLTVAHTNLLLINKAHCTEEIAVKMRKYFGFELSDWLTFIKDSPRLLPITGEVI